MQWCRVVDSLDLEARGFERTNGAATRRPDLTPGDMLWFNAALTGQRVATWQVPTADLLNLVGVVGPRSVRH